MTRISTPGTPSAVDPRLIDDLTARGLVHDSTARDDLARRLAAGPITVYVGFDPTATSLHAGNLLALLMLKRFQDAGHRPIALAGGATGMVGDPSGRSDERNLLDDATLAANLAGVVPQLRQFLDFERETNPAKLLDNRAWTVGMSYLEFLRDVGKHVTVNQMAAKDSVRNRMDSDQGISYTEFSYMLLQAHDFYWLYENEGCEMQMGGSDQWGNIVLGLDLIRRKVGGSGYALTIPLLTKPDGSKYGKTAGGDTMWLGAEKMSPYRFYQAWMQTEDDEVRKLLLQLTFLAVEEIEEIASSHLAAPHRREGQRRLAHELTALVHSPQAAQGAEAASAIVFGGPVEGVGLHALRILAEEIPTTVLGRDVLAQAGNLVPILRSAGIASSNSEATRLLAQNGIALNDHKVSSEDSLTSERLLHERFCLVRKGKKQVHLLAFEA
jgi:tyrosyl-tRNA synthetase